MLKKSISESAYEEREGYERSVLFGADEFGSNTKIQLMRLAAGQSIKPHFHRIRTECFMIISGSGAIRINGDMVGNSKDELILCEPGDVHEFINTSKVEPFVVLVIRINDPGNSDMIWEESQ